MADTLYDESGNNFHGIVNNVTYENGVIGQSGSFNGTDSMVTFHDKEFPYNKKTVQIMPVYLVRLSRLPLQ